MLIAAAIGIPLALVAAIAVLGAMTGTAPSVGRCVVAGRKLVGRECVRIWTSGVSADREPRVDGRRGGLLSQLPGRHR